MPRENMLVDYDLEILNTKNCSKNKNNNNTTPSDCVNNRVNEYKCNFYQKDRINKNPPFFNKKKKPWQNNKQRLNYKKFQLKLYI